MRSLCFLWDYVIILYHLPHRVDAITGSQGNETELTRRHQKSKYGKEATTSFAEGIYKSIEIFCNTERMIPDSVFSQLKSGQRRRSPIEIATLNQHTPSTIKIKYASPKFSTLSHTSPQ